MCMCVYIHIYIYRYVYIQLSKSSQGGLTVISTIYKSETHLRSIFRLRISNLEFGSSELLHKGGGLS